jgi:ABC-type sugar transport system permease subunit
MRDHWVGYALVLPTIIAFSTLFYYPLARGVMMTFQQVRLIEPDVWIGLDNYVWVLTNDLFYYAFGWTIVFAFSELVIVMAVGLLIAILVNEFRQGAREWLAAALISPYFAAPVASGAIWFWFLSANTGFISRFQTMFGTEVTYFLSGTLWPFISLIVAQSWHDYGYAAIIYIPAIASVPSSQYEAAAIAGANAFERFRDVTLPHIVTPTIIILALRTAFNITEFAQPFELTGGGPGTRTMLMSILMYEVAFNNTQFGRAFVIGLIMTAISLSAAIFYIKVIQEEEQLYV